MTTSESKGRFFYKTNRFESIRTTNRIANWNALVLTVVVSKDSTVNLCAIDMAKAYDKVYHHALYYLDMNIHCKKFSCLRIGPRHNAICANVVSFNGSHYWLTFI